MQIIKKQIKRKLRKITTKKLEQAYVVKYNKKLKITNFIKLNYIDSIQKLILSPFIFSL